MTVPLAPGDAASPARVPVVITGRTGLRAVRFDTPLLLAPMEGVTDRTFRACVLDLGGTGGACTEFLRIASSPALTLGKRRPKKARLAGKGRNTMALGARVTGRAGKLKVVQEVSGSTGYISAPDARLHFGLGAAKALSDVVVRWPDGKEQRVGDLAAGRDHVIEER